MEQSAWKLGEQKMPRKKRYVYKIAIVHRLTPKTNYTRLLEKGFRHSAGRANIIMYGNKEENLLDLPNAKNVWSSNFYPFQIFRQTLMDRPDIVHIQYEFTTFGPFWSNLFFPILLVLLRIAGVRAVVTVHSVIPKEMVDRDLMQKLLPQFTKFKRSEVLFKGFLVLLFKSIVILADVIIVHGKWYKRKLVDSYSAMSSKIWVVPYGVDDKGYVNGSLLNYWKERVKKRKVILFFGHISPRKDMETLIKAFGLFTKNHSGYQLVIAGRKSPYYIDYFNKLKSIVNELNLRKEVVFTGHVSDEEIHVLYNISELVIFPYLYAFEGPSGPLAFAIEHCVPLIGTKVGHLEEEIVHMKEGILVPPMDAQALATAIGILANNRGLRTKFSKNLKMKKNEMLWKDVASKTLQLYQGVIEGSKDRKPLFSRRRGLCVCQRTKAQKLHQKFAF
jgi:glycosyltransferase involved in cell wall biosynthesis